MNTNPEAKPVTGKLGQKQQEAVEGPDGPLIEQFVCLVCDTRHYDMKHYFYGIVSTRCLWCEKYQKVAKVATKSNG